MYRIQFTKIKVKSIVENNKSNIKFFAEEGENIFLDVWGERLLRQRYFLGRWSELGEAHLQQITYYTSGIVNIHLSSGPHRKNDLGTVTLFEFLRDPSIPHTQPGKVLTITFGR